MMADIPGSEPGRDDTGASGGARGGGDEDAQDWNLPGGPTEAPHARRGQWPGGARPKTKGPYTQLPQHDKDTPMTTCSKEKSGLPSTSKGTAETSFIERMPEERVKDMDSLKIELANQGIERQYPNYGKEGNLLILKVVAGKVVVAGPKGGATDKHLADGKTLNPQLLKLKFVQKTLGTTSQELIQQKEQEIQQNTQQQEELDKTIENTQKVADDENEQPSVRSQARERVTEDTARNAQLEQEKNQLEKERDQLEEKLPLRERVKNIFKKYGSTLQAVVLAVGVVLSALALAGLNGLKAGTKAVGQGLKAISQKLGSLLPGLIGLIVSFIFKAAGQVFSFLAEHAWLLILAVAAFFMERLLKKRRR